MSDIHFIYGPQMSWALRSTNQSKTNRSAPDIDSLPIWSSAKKLRSADLRCWRLLSHSFLKLSYNWFNRFFRILCFSALKADNQRVIKILNAIQFVVIHTNLWLKALQSIQRIRCTKTFNIYEYLFWDDVSMFAFLVHKLWTERTQRTSIKDSVIMFAMNNH